MFAPDETLLRVLIEQNPAHRIYHVSFTFDVPGKVIAAKEEGRDIASVTRPRSPKSNANSTTIAPPGGESRNGNASQGGRNFGDARRCHSRARANDSAV